MRAHDVRNLRHCDQCERLAYKEDFLASGHLCIACAWNKAGSIEDFVAQHPRAEWEKLPLNLIGLDAMQYLLHVIETEA